MFKTSPKIETLQQGYMAVLKLSGLKFLSSLSLVTTLSSSQLSDSVSLSGADPGALPAGIRPDLLDGEISNSVNLLP